MGVPVPRETAPPGHPGVLDMGLGYLPPCSYLAATGFFLFHKFLVWRIDKSVILKKICANEILGAKVLSLRDNRLVQNLFHGLIRSGLGVTDEIDNVDNPGRLGRLGILTGTAHQQESRESECQSK